MVYVFRSFRTFIAFGIGEVSTIGAKGFFEYYGYY
jgi:hypothetical protein